MFTLICCHREGLGSSGVGGVLVERERVEGGMESNNGEGELRCPIINGRVGTAASVGSAIDMQGRAARARAQSKPRCIVASSLQASRSISPNLPLKPS